MTQRPKIAILHDAFLYRGGGERLVTLMAKTLDADIIAGFFSAGSFDPRELGFTGKIIALGQPVFLKGIRHMILKWRFFFQARVLSEYDIVVFSGDCLGAIRHVRKDAKKIYYCHTPPRYLYDFRQKYLMSLHALLRPIFSSAFSFFSRIYETHLEEFDTIFTNSKNTHDRLLHYCNKDSIILYPPTDTARFAPLTRGEGDDQMYLQNLRNITSHKSGYLEPGQSSTFSIQSVHLPYDYYLSCSRLSPPKRVDLVVEAFQEMPDKNLVFTYGHNDPEKERILALCQGYPNIIPLPAPKEDDFIRLLSGAIANIYIPVDEDFGMTPVESMACSVPVLGVREGGLLETVVEGQTGKLIEIINPKSGIMNLQEIIQNTSMDEWKNMKNACVERSRIFSLEKFGESLRKYNIKI